MATFLQTYLLPDLGHEISCYLSVDDDARLDSVSKDIRAFHRESVYPLYRHIDLDILQEESMYASLYLRKMSPYLETIDCSRNERQIGIPRHIRNLPKVKRIRYAVPILLNVSEREIDASTIELWRRVEHFVRSLFIVPNCVEKVEIVPGVITLMRTDFETGEILAQHVLDDTTENSHLRMYDTYATPRLLTLDPVVGHPLASIKLPKRLAVGGTENLFQDWNADAEAGVASSVLDLYI